MTPRRPEQESGTLFYANLLSQFYPNWARIWKRLNSETFCNQVLKSSMTLRCPERESGALFYANLLLQSYPNWARIWKHLASETFSNQV